MTEPEATDHGAATGHPRVDAAIAELDRITALPPAEQVAGFTAVHQELQATLSELDEGR
jgi:hypothetical protein